MLSYALIASIVVGSGASATYAPRGDPQTVPLISKNKKTAYDPAPELPELEMPPLEETPEPTKNEVFSTEAPKEPRKSPSAVGPMGIGIETGILIPRGALNPAPIIALRFEVVPAHFELAALPAELKAFASAGWVHLAYQDQATLIPNRGKGQLIQNTTVIPLDLGVGLSISPMTDIGIVASLGFAADISRTQIKVFSLEAETENDFSTGFSASLGATIKIAGGQIFVQLRQREIGADLDTWQNVAEPQMASTGFSLGYVFSFSD